MAAPWEEDGAWGSASRVPDNTWFPVDTMTGEWGLPGRSTPTLGAVSGAALGLDLDLTTPWSGAGQGYGVQAPGIPTMGQVTGLGAPTRATPSALPRPPGREPLSAFLPQQPSVWESIARGVGMATPQGRQILQGYDQQQQQGLTNRLALRRQQLQEDQETRQAVKDDYTTLLEMSKLKSKALRNMYFDRFAAQKAEAGQPLPPDLIETYKKSALDEGLVIAQAYGPLLEKAGFKADQIPTILESMDLDTIKGLLEGGLKVQKADLERQEIAGLDASRQRAFGTGTLGDVSGVTVQAPAVTTGTPAPPPPPTPGPTARPGTVPQVIETAVQDATKLYPQVRLALVHGMIRHESNYDVGAVSPKGATGAMQLMPGTAKEMGVDDPKDPGQNVRGGTRYFAQLLTKYHGNEAVALAAYNWGPGNVDKVGGDLTKMPAETQAYVKNVLASAAPGGQRGPADTRQQVAGPGAPAPMLPAQEQAKLRALETRITVLDQEIGQMSGRGGERTRAHVNDMQQERTRLIAERKELLEPLRLEERKRLEEPYELRKAEASKALTPIATETSKTIANNNSLYRSIGKIETLMQDVGNLPPDFINLVARNAPEVQAALASDPAQLTGIIQGWKTQLGAASSNDPRINRFLSALGNLRDLAIAERAGASVTGNELTRATGAFFGSLPNINQAFSLFAENMANVKERVMDQLVTMGSTVKPLAGGRAVYGGLPKEVRDRIERYERGEYDEPPKASTPPTTTTPPAASSPTKPPNAPGGRPVAPVRPGPTLP